MLSVWLLEGKILLKLEVSKAGFSPSTSAQLPNIGSFRRLYSGNVLYNCRNVGMIGWLFWHPACYIFPKTRSIGFWLNFLVSTYLKSQECVAKIHMSFVDCSVTTKPSPMLFVRNMSFKIALLTSCSSHSSSHFCPFMIMAKSLFCHITPFLKWRFIASNKSLKIGVNSFVASQF